MKNPLFNNTCIRCGSPLIDLTSAWGMCTTCAETTEKQRAKILQRKKEDKDSPRRVKVFIPKFGKPQSHRQ